MKTRLTVADLDRSDGTITEIDVDKADILNSYFTSVFNITTFERTLHNTEELTDFMITDEKVENILKTLKTTKPVRSEVMEHVLINNLLSSFQHGFVHGLSCTTQLLVVLDKWTEAIEQGDSIDAIYLDFATLPHQRLLVKLKGYEICGKMLQWTAALLDVRRQRVIINGSKLSWTPSTSVIPKGSVLGPILFVCYINDMPEVVDSPVHMFADDTKIYRQITTQSDQETLQAAIK